LERQKYQLQMGCLEKNEFKCCLRGRKENQEVRWKGLGGPYFSAFQKESQNHNFKFQSDCSKNNGQLLQQG